MEKNQAMKEMQAIAEGLFKSNTTGDSEEKHTEAAWILCEFLISIGHDDLVKIYYDVDKWYAQ
jgi:hypothetical protein